MVDGKFCTVGSANLNARSLSWDYEENAVIVDPSTTRELNDLFDKEKKTPLSLRPLRGTSFGHLFRNFVAGLPTCLHHFYNK